MSSFSAVWLHLEEAADADELLTYILSRLLSSGRGLPGDLAQDRLQ